MYKKIIAFSLCLMLLFTLSSCGKKSTEDDSTVTSSLYQLNSAKTGDTVVTIVTSKGTIKAVLYKDLAPNAVNNFTRLADSGYYDGVLIHKVIEDFVIQMGDGEETLTGTGGSSYNGRGVEPEYSDSLHNFTGALGLVHGDDDDLGYSQFYIVAGSDVSDEYISAMREAGYSEQVIAAYQELGGQPSLDYVYTVFGQVYEGLDIVQEIASQKTDKYNRPKKDITVESITVSSYAG